MKKLNSPYLAALTLIAFIALCYYCYPPVVTVIVPTDQQDGYGAKDRKEMRLLIDKQLKQAHKIENARNIIAIFDPKE